MFVQVLNDYLIEYKNFMEDFPEMHKIKEDNNSQFHKCKELLEFIESIIKKFINRKQKFKKQI